MKQIRLILALLLCGMLFASVALAEGEPDYDEPLPGTQGSGATAGIAPGGYVAEPTTPPTSEGNGGSGGNSGTTGGSTGTNNPKTADATVLSVAAIGCLALAATVIIKKIK